MPGPRYSSGERRRWTSTLSGPSHPPQSGGKPTPAGDPAAWARRRRQRSDRAGALLGAAAARRRVPVAQRAVSLRHGALTAINGSARRIQPGGACWPACAPPRRSSTPSSTRSWPERGLTESELALVGFSQGTMMSLFVGLRREKPLAGIVGFSGRLIAPELLASRNPFAAAGAAGPRHRRPAGAVRLAGRGGKGAHRRRRPGRDADLPRHRPLDRRGRACAAAGSSSSGVLSERP